MSSDEYRGLAFQLAPGRVGQGTSGSSLLYLGVTMSVSIRLVPRLFDLRAVPGAVFSCFF